MVTRLGVLGGTFDPIHFGHLIIAEEARVQLRLPEVRFIPAGQPPHKGERRITPGRHRLEMVRRAVADNPAFTVSAQELDRPGPSYTVDTLAWLQEEQGPQCSLYFVVGGDALADLLAWREPDRLLRLATLVAVRRPGAQLADIRVLEARLPGLRQRLILLDSPQLDVSGSDIRRRVCAGLPIRYQVPEPVRSYIEEEGLYRDHD